MKAPYSVMLIHLCRTRPPHIEDGSFPEVVASVPVHGWKTSSDNTPDASRPILLSEDSKEVLERGTSEHRSNRTISLPGLDGNKGSVYGTDATVTPLHLLGDQSDIVDCPFCRRRTETRVKLTASTAT
ncbi:hypothetical protein S40288_07064, partial [Stachybotrys chartarum IBT 40288]